MGLTALAAWALFAVGAKYGIQYIITKNIPQWILDICNPIKEFLESLYGPITWVLFITSILTMWFFGNYVILAFQWFYDVFKIIIKVIIKIKKIIIKTIINIIIVVYVFVNNIFIGLFQFFLWIIKVIFL
ncbi:MAG: hypothetical protein ACLTFB_00930 [Candidatus Phytoplasma pyri]|uniref:hypothetical protein n=1 Tax=Candidatus Phytoplasma pyri TaxID=47566 RepID=UPI003983AB6F